MNILIKNLQNYDIVIHYHSFEKAYYQILHEEFIKNDMVNFIECLIIISSYYVSLSSK